MRVAESEFRQITGGQDLTCLVKFVERLLSRAINVEMASARVESEATEINQAGPPEVHLGNDCVVKATARSRLDGDDPGPSRIQNKYVSARRVDGHALRVPQAKMPGIVANHRPRVQVAVGALRNLNQLVGRELKDEQTIELAIKGHVNRVLNRRRDPG